MLRKVRARISNGKIEPLEDLELPEGEEVVIVVKQPSNKEAIKALIKTKSKRKGTEPDGFDRAAGSREGTLDFDAFLEDLRESRKRDRPLVNLD